MWLIRRWICWQIFIPFLSSMLFFLGGCSTISKKGESCFKNEDCEEGLKCILGYCGDGREGSFCTSDLYCLQGYQCIQTKCTNSIEYQDESKKEFCKKEQESHQKLLMDNSASKQKGCLPIVISKKALQNCKTVATLGKIRIPNPQRATPAVLMNNAHKENFA